MTYQKHLLAISNEEETEHTRIQADSNPGFVLHLLDDVGQMYKITSNDITSPRLQEGSFRNSNDLTVYYLPCSPKLW
jgi:hypothetical protein